MVNLQLIDTLDGGSLVFQRKDYILDKGIYTELYCALFATRSATWLGDQAFDIDDYKIASRTENALGVYNSNTPDNIALIKSAVKADCERFMKKNANITVSEITLRAYVNNALEIMIKIEGINETYDFIVQKTEESLENIQYLDY
jgi:hypothetical protein